jgi:hypothetical protein
VVANEICPQTNTEQSELREPSTTRQLTPLDIRLGGHVLEVVGVMITWKSNTTHPPNHALSPRLVYTTSCLTNDLSKFILNVKWTFTFIRDGKYAQEICALWDNSWPLHKVHKQYRYVRLAQWHCACRGLAVCYVTGGKQSPRLVLCAYGSKM